MVVCFLDHVYDSKILLLMNVRIQQLTGTKEADVDQTRRPPIGQCSMKRKPMDIQRPKPLKNHSQRQAVEHLLKQGERPAPILSPHLLRKPTTSKERQLVHLAVLQRGNQCSVAEEQKLKKKTMHQRISKSLGGELIRCKKVLVGGGGKLVGGVGLKTWQKHTNPAGTQFPKLKG